MATTATTSGHSIGDAPARAGLILTTLILSAAVANMNLSVANVALPTIGRDLGASQTQLNLVAVGFTLGLAASVLYLGAKAIDTIVGIGDESVANEQMPDRLSSGITVIGKNAYVPDGAHIGCNVLINSDRDEKYFPSDRMVADGKTI
jgi:hypothetical protein